MKQICFLMIIVSIQTYAENIDPYNTDAQYGWSENIDWIHFDSTQTWDARACIVTIDDLIHFASYWLQSGTLPAQLNGTGRVDNADFNIFAQYWLDFCPNGWQLK
jgi:hypothetical protein